MDYRLLTDEEIAILEDNGCWSEDWSSINVADDFNPAYIRNVSFYGDVFLGVFEKNIEVSPGFVKHSGIRNATLRNVTIGDNCLIENIGNFINNYIIGEECHICNVCTMETTDGATFGEGITISVLNEAGSGNVILFRGLTSSLATIMVSRSKDKELSMAIRKMVREDISNRIAGTGTIGDRVKIVNTSEITNTHISDDCEINGACRLSDCTIAGELDNTVYIGSGVICENSIIVDGSAVLNSSKINNCFVGECCQITNGFTAESSLFFVNTYMSNGEACASFCGPFSSSHHKSTLLIGGMFSFYNAGSATNFSNHAYKIGPVHYGILERGCKTASGSHILMPATIGSFSVCLGKISNHPDTSSLPFSYVIADGKETYIVPGKNLVTVGLYRDVRKWQRRDVRPTEGKKSVINYNWLNPCTINEILRGIKTLRRLQETEGNDVDYYTFENCRISRSSLQKGLKYYAMAIDMFISDVLKDNGIDSAIGVSGSGEWVDLSGLLLPLAELDSIIEDVKEHVLGIEIIDRLNALDDCYGYFLWTYTRSLITSYLGIDELSENDVVAINESGDEAHRLWISEIKSDAVKEHRMGDVEPEVLDKILAQLDEELQR
ncbi:MAG: DUF4954 family protein [Prevotellaceae bacterium]|nr:DUF4954 family protein [Prevotellaceae bacterium]